MLPFQVISGNFQLAAEQPPCHDIAGHYCHRGAPMTSSYPNPSQPSPQPPMAQDTTVALVIYVLYFVAYFTGITSLVGVIMAHIQVGSTNDPLLVSHYRFQIRTFWIG